MKTIGCLALSATLLFSLEATGRADSDDDDDRTASAAAPADGDNRATGDRTAQARQHYRAGLEAFRAARYDEAVAELNQAYALKPLPLLLVNLGTTYRKMGDLERAAQCFKKYLEEAPADAHDRGDVKAALLEAERQLGRAGKDADPSPEKLEHAIIDAAPPDTPVDVHASLPASEVELFLYYRQSGEARFTRVAMRSRGSERQARIPAQALSGVAMEYYLEARDPRGEVLETSGTPGKPNIVLVDPSAPPQVTEERRAPEPDAPEPQQLRELDNESAPLGDGKAHAARRRLGAVFYSGLVMAAVGAGGLALGITGNLMARQQASSLTNDSQHSPSFQFSDPTAPGGRDDAYFQSQGKLWNTIGIAGSVAGGVVLAAGLTMMIVDGARHHHAPDKRKPHRDDE